MINNNGGIDASFEIYTENPYVSTTWILFVSYCLLITVSKKILYVMLIVSLLKYCDLIISRIQKSDALKKCTPNILTAFGNWFL